MKKYLLTAFLLCTLTGLKAQHSKKMKNDIQDSTAIANSLENFYFKGIYEGNLDLLNQVFNTAHCYSVMLKANPMPKRLSNISMVSKTGKAQKIPESHSKVKSSQLNWLTLLLSPK